MTAIRLEALPDPSLPKGGPGRDPYGNFVLNGIEIDRWRHARGESSRSVQTRQSAARVWMRFFRRRCRAMPPLRADGASMRAARRNGCPGRSSSRSTNPLRAPGPLRDSAEVSQGAAVGQSLGRFRVSVSSSATPERVVELPARLRPALESRRERANRTAAERSRRAFIAASPCRSSPLAIESRSCRRT